MVNLEASDVGMSALETQWNRHYRDQLLISCTHRRMKEAMHADFMADRVEGMKEGFMIL